jgi:hypothetical protein
LTIINQTKFSYNTGPARKWLNNCQQTNQSSAIKELKYQLKSIKDAKENSKDCINDAKKDLKDCINDAKKDLKDCSKTQLQLNNQVMLNIYLSKM